MGTLTPGRVALVRHGNEERVAPCIATFPDFSVAGGQMQAVLRVFGTTAPAGLGGVVGENDREVTLPAEWSEACGWRFPPRVG